MFGYLKNLFQLIISPQSAWEDISAEMCPLRLLMRRGLMPMVAVACAAQVIQKVLYLPETGWGQLVVMLMATVASYVCTYFIFGHLLYNRARTMTDTGELSLQKCCTVQNYVLGLLALVQTVTWVLPPSMALSYLLPAGVSIVMWKAETYLAIRKDMTLSYYLWGTGCLILPPYFIQGFFKTII